MQVKIICIGDKIIFRGNFGHGKPEVATVVALDKTEIPRDKYGKPTNKVTLQDVKENKVIFSLDNSKWCYAEQVTHICEEIA